MDAGGKMKETAEHAWESLISPVTRMQGIKYVPEFVVRVQYKYL